MSSSLALKFFQPPICARFRCSGTLAAFMPVLEAAVDEDDGFIFR